MDMKTKRTLTLSTTALAVVLLSSAGLQEHRLEQMNTMLVDAGEKLPTKNNTAFHEGEKLTYRLHYGVINAGIAELEVKPDLLKIQGREVYHIVGTGYTTGSTDWFFKVRDRYETYMDKDALLPWYFVRRVEEGGYKFSQDYSFNHYTRKVDIGQNQKLDIPMGVQDMVSAFYAARNMNLSHAKPGDILSMVCFMDKELWPMQIKMIGREVIETDLGPMRCLKFRPIVQKGRVFKQEEDLTVWISDDANHVPVRAQADILVGSIKMDLTAVKNLSSPLAKVSL
jgi:hypothetical protein